MARISIKGRMIAMLATDGFELAELIDTRERLEKAGATVEVIAPARTQVKGQIRGWKARDWGDSVKVDRTIDEARPEAYDAVVIPGGLISPDLLRMEEKAIAFLRAFGASGKPLAAICHGTQLLINADLVRNRKLTSWPSLATDLRNAGGHWQDSEVVVDGTLITSRKPADIPAFSRAVIHAVEHTTV
jgi:protease I